ncbi:MAG: glycosyltransferase [Promethearchaeota archaeon]
MKITIVNDFVPIPSAATINLLKHANAFHKLNYLVEILTIEHFAQTKWRIKIKRIHDFFKIPSNIRINYLIGNLIFYFRKYRITWPIIKFIEKIPALYRLFDPQIKAFNKIIKNKTDFIYCRHVYRTALNALLNGIPTIIETHNYSRPLDFLKLIKLSKNSNFKGLITISEQLKARFLRLGVPAEKILVLEDAVDLDKFEAIRESKESLRRKLSLPINKKIILYAGNLSEDRDIATILEAAALLNSPTFSFYFIGGSRTEIRHWKRYINTRGIRADIHFLGFQPPRVIPHYLKAANVLLATYSPRCLTLKWMSPLKLFEYMASRTPIIASRIGRLPEICSNGEALFVEPENGLDLSEKIMFLLESKSIHQTLIEKAFKKASEHTYLKRCETILNFCK